MITVGHLTGISHRDSHTWLWMIVGKAISEKSDRTTRRSKWIPCLEKFSKKSWWAFLSQNQTWVGVGSEEDVLEQRRFRDGVDLRLGAMCSLSKREREGERERNKKKKKSQQSTNNRKEEGMYAWKMQEYVTCKKNVSWVQPNPNLTTHNFQHSST